MTDKVYRMLQFERGIGDLLMSMYGVYAFCMKHDFPKVQLFTYNHSEWLELFDIPNFEYHILNPGETVSVDYVIGDTFAEAQVRWRLDADVKEWYAQKLGCSPLIPPLKQNYLQQEMPPIPEPYIVLSPFASITTRTWEIHNWRILARKLKEAGYTCIALDSPNQTERCRPVEVQYFWGQPIEWVTKVCKNAALVISNDSGLAHLCSLIDKTALVVLSQMNPRAYYSLSNHRFVMPENIACAECRVLADRGYEEKCDYGCWALQSISPNRVFQTAMEILNPVP